MLNPEIKNKKILTLGQRIQKIIELCVNLHFISELE